MEVLYFEGVVVLSSLPKRNSVLTFSIERLDSRRRNTECFVLRVGRNQEVFLKNTHDADKKTKLGLETSQSFQLIKYT